MKPTGDCGCVMRWDLRSFKLYVAPCSAHDTPEERARVALVLDLAEDIDKA